MPPNQADALREELDRAKEEIARLRAIVDGRSLGQYEPKLTVDYSVVAYDESGYGENCSREFTSGTEAIEYAACFEERFGASVWKRIKMEPLNIKLTIPEDLILRKAWARYDSYVEVSKQTNHHGRGNADYLNEFRPKQPRPE